MTDSVRAQLNQALKPIRQSVLKSATHRAPRIKYEKV
jgi:hypothetical protein